MRTTKTNRALLISSVAGVTALAMASTAVACTTYKGKVTLTASGGVATAEGAPGVHEYCAPQQRQNIAILGTFRLDVTPGPVCGTQLGAGAYKVQWLNLAPTQVHTAAPNNCNAVGLPMGVINVGADGKGGGTFVMPQPGGGPAPVGWVNICIEPGAPGDEGDKFRPGAPELYLNLI